MVSYYDRVRASLATRGEARGIPAEESGSVVAFIEMILVGHGVTRRLSEMSEHELTGIEMQLDRLFYEYLGKKRR